MRRIVSILVENEAGSLARIVGLFAQRGYNIDSLNVAPTDERALSRITLITHCDDKILEQVIKQLNKLINVYKVFELNKSSHIEQELALIKLHIDPKRGEREEVISLVEIFDGVVLDISPKHISIRIAGVPEQINKCIVALSHLQIVEVARTGITAFSNSARTLK